MQGASLFMSAIFPLEVAPAQSVNATKLRNLDTFEEFFWLIEQSAPLFHAVVAKVNGTTTIEQWKEALDAIQIRYPLLSASIRKVPGKRPFFEKVWGVSMPLRIAPLTDSLVLEEEMEKELQHPFGDGSSPLTRATLFHAPDRSVLMFATHHSSLDGKSHLLLVQDSLASVAGEDLGEPLEVQPGLGQLLGLPDPAEYGKTLEGRSLTLAGKRYSEKWKMGPVRCSSPIDMRKSLGIPDVAGMLVSTHRAPVLTPDGASFWDIARAVRKDMLPAQSIDGARHILSALSSMTTDELSARDLYWSVLNGPRAHELMVTNYAGYQVRKEYGGLKIENLFTGSPSVTPALQKVSVLTVNGRLGMTLVARDIFPTLLEDAREILTRV
jgi:hypothetical protein